MSFSITVPGPCACCQSTGTCFIECGIRGGTYALIGLDEFTDPFALPFPIAASQPPKRYRRGVFTGNTYMYDSGVSCAVDDGAGRQTQTYSGLCFYDKNTGLITAQTGKVRTVLSGCYGTSDQTDDLNCGGNLRSGARIPLKTLSTTHCQAKGIGCNLGLCSGGSLPNFADPARIADYQYDQEDTEQDAIDRLFLGPAGDWSTYAPDSQCLAQYPTRGAFSFTGVIREARYRIKASGLSSFSVYDTKVQIWRRPYGVGDFVLFAQDEDTITADDHGFYTGPDVIVPNESGFETYAAGCSIRNPI